MPPKKGSPRVQAVTVETPSRRKGGSPKKLAVEIAETQKDDEAADNEPLASLAPAPRKRGRPPKKAKPVEPEPEPEDAEPSAVGEDQSGEEVLEEDEPEPKKRAASRSPAAPRRRGRAAAKTDDSAVTPGTPSKDGAGDGDNLLQCGLCNAKVVQLVRHIRAQHGDAEDYDTKIKEARALEAKAQTTTPRKVHSGLLEELNVAATKMEKSKSEPRSQRTRESSDRLVRPKNTQCPICEKVVRRYDLNKHIRNVHSGEKPNKCPYCDYASPWKGNLNTHIAGVHTKARLHDCVRCGLAFKTRSAMIGHIRKVHDKMYQPKERNYECEECGKKFFKKFHLQRHIRVHTGEKPFTCAFCDKKFASKTNMDSHIQSVHLRIKPFKCGYCEKGFGRKKMMLIHIRKYHMNQPEGDEAAEHDITLNDEEDDNLDNIDDDSNASLESGEVLQDGDGPQMVLVKVSGKSDSDVKQYMFVPADGVPSDIDTTLNTTGGDQSRMDSNAEDEDEDDSEKEELVLKSRPSLSAEVVNNGSGSNIIVNISEGQVLQAVQTSGGLVLVAQPSILNVTPHVDSCDEGLVTTVRPIVTAVLTNSIVPTAINTDLRQDMSPIVHQPEVEEQPVLMTQRPPPPLDLQKLVEETLGDTLPPSIPDDGSGEVTESIKRVEELVNDNGLEGPPENLLATEGEQNDGSNVDADFDFLLNSTSASN